MTSLGILDMLEPRVSRPTGASSSSPPVTPSGAAFADVIQDAARLAADDAAASTPSTETATDDPSTDLAAPSAAPATPILPLAVPASVPTLGGVSMDAAPNGEDAAAALAPTDSIAASAPVATAETNARPAPVPSMPVAPPAAGAATAAPPTTTTVSTAPSTPDAALVQPPLPDQARIRTAPATAALGTGSVSGAGPTTTAVGEPTSLPTPADDPTAAVPRLATPGGSTIDAAVPSEQPAARTAAHAGALAPAALAADSADSADSAGTTAPAAPVSTAAAPTATTSPASSGDALPAPAAVGSTPAPMPVAAASAPVVVPAARPALLPQLTTPIVALAQAPDGDHSLTLTVSPENLGPVTVRAHISGGAIHIELHAPNDLGREALRAILADLRRDLAGAAPHASLLLSSSDDGPSTSQSFANGNGNGNGSAHSSSAPGANGGHSGGAPAGRDAAITLPGADAPPAVPDDTHPASPFAPHGGIDVFA